MTALQRLQDAITKLEDIRIDLGDVELSADGQLFANADHDFDDDGEPYVYGQRIEMPDCRESAPEVFRAIVILTRPATLDAQLSILAYGATLVGPIPECILALADSILDGEQ